MTVVVAALEREVRPLVHRLDGARRAAPGGVDTVRGRLAGRRLAVAAGGEGAAGAEAAARLLDALPVHCLLGVGLAGGLSPGLAAGAVVEAIEVRRGDAVVGRRLSPPLAGVRRATAITVERLAVTVAEKRALCRLAPAGRPAVVDLESAGWVAAAEARGVAWRVFRAVSDPAQRPLPLDFDRFRGPDGRVAEGRVLRFALLRPLVLLSLLRLALAARRGARRLAGVVERVVAA